MKLHKLADDGQAKTEASVLAGFSGLPEVVEDEWQLATGDPHAVVVHAQPGTLAIALDPDVDVASGWRERAPSHDTGRGRRPVEILLPAAAGRRWPKAG